MITVSSKETKQETVCKRCPIPIPTHAIGLAQSVTNAIKQHSYHPMVYSLGVQTGQLLTQTVRLEENQCQ